MSKNMSEQESKDLEEMKAKVVEAKIRCFDYIRSVTRFTETDLKHSGYTGKTTAQAIEMIVNKYIKDIDKLTMDYFKKYPD